jgi:16S rRNA (adenine1518-N6/adenine1519-N6)-dimethyltransferase
MNYLKKSLGQNFLIDKNIITKIVKLTEIKNKNIIEIGPGKGALTSEILKYKPKSLIIIEKDSNLVKFLEKKYHNKSTLKIFNEDILNFDLERIIKKNSIIFGNLPYNISSQILVKILRFKNWPPKFNDLIFMFQRELGEKIIGKFTSDSYGRLSILTNLKLKIHNKFLVSANSFFPKPKITSMVISFKPKKNNTYKIKDINNLEKITNIFFSNKRKMINKNIKKILSNENINKIKNLKMHLRPSDLKPEIYYKITSLFEKKL